MMGFEKELYWPPVNLFEDFKYSIGLLFKTKRKLINMKDFEKIRQLEKEAYPDSICVYDKIKSIRALLDCLDCYNKRQLDYYLGEECYYFIVLHYNCICVWDLVSLNNPQDTIRMLLSIQSKYKGIDIYMHAREKTSYPLLKILEKKGRIKIAEDKTEEKCDELFHEMKISIV